MSYLGQRRGSVLIVVLGVLAILALLATSFATLQATERQITRNYLDTVRAKLAAQSGVQEAEARLREQFPARYFEGLDLNPPRPRAWKYYGDDIDERTEPPVEHKLEEARNPSFARERDDDPLDQNPQPQLIKINGRDYGYSGTHGGGFYGLNSEHYALKVSDLSGRIYVNDGVDSDPKAGADNSVSQNLKRILNILGDVQSVTQLGDKIIRFRPPGGYRHVNDLLRVVDYDEQQFARFRDYVTVNAWVDKNVANPVPLSEAYANDEELTYGVKYYRGSPPVYRAGSDVRGIDANNNPVIFGGLGAASDSSLQTYPHGTSEPRAQRISLHGLDTLNPQWIEIVARAPVNVNAAPKPVLVALLTGIRGHFVGYRRRNNPNHEGDPYLFFKGQNSLRPGGPGGHDSGDEYGVLMDTVEIVNERQTTDNNRISAWVLAEEIVACRERRNTAYCNYSDRDKYWFAGPFRDWHQFNAFIDNLARPKDDGDYNPLMPVGPALLRDNRPVHWDFEQEASQPAGGGRLEGLPYAQVQQEHASRAIADALKANFNPNLHLNETNPDENLYLRVDKTDLFVNSTEFCFLPTGYFEVESVGRVVRPSDPTANDALTGNNVLVAQARVKAVYKLYDMVRETSQKNFYEGTLSPMGSSGFQTSNGKSLEVGPEPDNGIFPGSLGAPGDPDNEWGGYIALPTVGGPAGFNKQKNTQMTSKQLGNRSEFGSAMNVHFTLDFDANGHQIDQAEIGSNKLGPDDEIENYGDWVGNATSGRQWPVGGPYHPAMSTSTTPIRIARSFRMSKSAGGNPVQPGLSPYPPSDLRIDGGYVERHAAPCYLMQRGAEQIWNWAEDDAQGTVSFWWKPSYYPELTGKLRTMIDLSRYHEPCHYNVHVFPFTLSFMPGHYERGEEAMPEYRLNSYRHFHPSSLTWGCKSNGGADHNVTEHQFGTVSGCLNHDGHRECQNEPGKHSIIRAHRWIHTGLKWNLAAIDGNPSDEWNNYRASELHLNGDFSKQSDAWTLDSWKAYSYTKATYQWISGKMTRNDDNPRGETIRKMREWAEHSGFKGGAGTSKNQLRFGGPSEIGSGPKDKTPRGWEQLDVNASTEPLAYGYRGNFTGDHTIDEIYVWATAAPSPQTLWQRGRYATPEVGSVPARFESRNLDLGKTQTERRLAAPSAALAPGGGPGSSVAAPPIEPPRIRILGMSWTWYGEGLKAREYADVWDGDYKGQKTLCKWGSMKPLGRLEPSVQVSIIDGSMEHGPYSNEYFSPVLGSYGGTPFIGDPKSVKYRVEFSTGAKFGDILLATPVFDDITIFFDDNQSHLLSYVFDNRSF